MRTVLFAICVGVVALLAAACSLSGETKEKPEASSQPTAEDEGLARLREARVAGTLYFTDRSCKLRAVRLPGLRPAQLPPVEGHCRFSLSPDEEGIDATSVRWSPDGTLKARPLPGHIELATDSTAWRFTFQGFAPSFKPDGTPTFVREGRLLAWTKCSSRNGVAFPDQTSRCAREVFSDADLERAFSDPARYLRAVYTIKDVQWLDDATIAVLVHSHERPGRNIENLVAIFRNRGLIAVPHFSGEPYSDFRLSPKRRYIHARGDDTGRVYVFRRRGDEVSTVLVSQRASNGLAFSPDERWVALGNRGNMTVVRTDQLRDHYYMTGRARLIPVPLRVFDLDWR